MVAEEYSHWMSYNRAPPLLSQCKNYEEKLVEKYDAIEKFESYKQTKDNENRDFLTEFDRRHYKTKTYINYPDDLLAYRLPPRFYARTINKSDDNRLGIWWS